MIQLINYINSYTKLNNSELYYIENNFIYEKFNKGELLISSQRKVNYIYFLIKGLVKGFEYENGKVIVQHLIEKNNFFTDFESFINKQVSHENYQAITNIEVLKISYEKFQTLQEKSPSFQTALNKILQESLSCKMERLQDFQKLNAKERYLKLLNSSPNLIQEVSISDLSSYLGIEPSSLSRIRKQVF
ncbi:Crp/Fnr family transcriptional regulator [Tenacibaculum jejuense]|uniref:Putative transcriptional regulator, Crp/Fnr family n=1 Tax=Tenacibaculum jejuense TaxID=584609 RepID=A0A238UCN9_9FLAO|nr:Crp/Fnr family transcriptional regulator [Tenacibaculum jejuense]SNR16160.1 Putative transcriptional regulator, Crp/Fnr family [Tenacibaculum jejuense]